MWLKLNGTDGERYLVNSSMITYVERSKSCIPNEHNTVVHLTNIESVFVRETLDEIARLLDDTPLGV